MYDHAIILVSTRIDSFSYHQMTDDLLETIFASLQPYGFYLPLGCTLFSSVFLLGISRKQNLKITRSGIRIASFGRGSSVP